MRCFFSWSSPSTWAHRTSQLRPLSWQQISHWQRKPSASFFFFDIKKSNDTTINLFHSHRAVIVYILDVFRPNNPLNAAFVHGFVPSISEQPDLVPVTAFAKVVTELPLSVSGWVTPSQSMFKIDLREAAFGLVHLNPQHAHFLLLSLSFKHVRIMLFLVPSDSTVYHIYSVYKPGQTLH